MIHLRMGDLTPADVRVNSGSILLDQSALTGESAPVEIEAGGAARAGTVVQRGEASGEVTATGARTAFGKTAEVALYLLTLDFLKVRMVRAFQV